MNMPFYSLAFWQGIAQARMAVGGMRGVNGKHGRAFRQGVKKVIKEARVDVSLSEERRTVRLAEALDDYSRGNYREGFIAQKIRQVGVGIYNALTALHDCHPCPDSTGISHIPKDREVANDAMNRILRDGLD